MEEDDFINVPDVNGYSTDSDDEHSREAVRVMIDDNFVAITPYSDIDCMEWNRGLWYKELFITYDLKNRSSRNLSLTNYHNDLFDNTWIEAVWNNMRKKYNAFLKNINTKQRTLRFSVLTDLDFRRLKRRASHSLSVLQREMLTGTLPIGLELKHIAEEGSRPTSAGMARPTSAGVDSGLETDNVTSTRSSLGESNSCANARHIINTIQKMNSDLKDIKQSVLNLHGCECVIDKPRRTPFPKRKKLPHVKKHPHRNVIREHFLTSTDEDNFEMPYVSEDLYQEDQWIESPLGLTGHRDRRNVNHRDTKPKLFRFQLQETPDSKILDFKRDILESRHGRKASTGSELDEKRDSDAFPQPIWKNDQEHHRHKIQRHSDVYLASQSVPRDIPTPVFRSSVKVLKPRTENTEQKQGNSSFTDNDLLQNYPKEVNITGTSSSVSNNQPACQTPAVEPRHDLLFQTDKRQKSNEDLATQEKHRRLEGKGQHENPKTGIVSEDVKLLLDNAIAMMEQRGEVDLETDGINDPELLSKIFSRNKQEKIDEDKTTEDLKKKENKGLTDEIISQEAEQSDDAAVKHQGLASHQVDHSDGAAVKHQGLASHQVDHSDGAAVKHQDLECYGVPKVSCTTFTGSRVTDTTRLAETGDQEDDCSESILTSTTEDPGWSIENDYSSPPSVNAEIMLQRVGLDHTNESLLQVLKKNKQSIEDSSQEAKGNGIDTVLLVDASSSMDEKSFEQMKSACLNIVEFIESAAAEKNIEENLGLVVFGRNPMILQHLTVDYRKLYDKIENIDPGGSSPLCLGTMLSMMELHLRGGTTSIARYQIPPRVIILTDGRPTDDTRFQRQEIEFAVKSPTVKENVLLAMDEMRHHGYKVICVPVGQAINRAFLADMVRHADGSIVEIDDLSTIKKHFMLQYTIARVIGVCRETGSEFQYHRVLRRETAGLVPSSLEDVSFTKEDVTMITTELEKSEELKDIEYPDLNLPPIGSRVSIPANPMLSHSGESKEYGTVIQQKSNGTIKIEWDVGMFSFLDDSTDREKLRLDRVQGPRRLTKGSLIEVGVEVIKVAEIESDTLHGRVYLTTPNGYVKVRWDDGSIGRYKYGADGTFELYITLKSYALDSYVWQYQLEDERWITYPIDNQQKLDSAYIKQSKTATCRTTGSSGRIKFADMTETQTLGNDLMGKRPVRRITVAEMMNNAFYSK